MPFIMFSPRGCSGVLTYDLSKMKGLGMMIYASNPSIWRTVQTSVGYIATPKEPKKNGRWGDGSVTKNLL